MSIKSPCNYGSPCSAVGCALRAGTNLFSTIKMFSFPKDPERRRLWIAALNRKDFKPSQKSRICSRHFITGQRSNDPQHPDYVPSKFDHNKKCGPEEDKRKMERYERSTRRLEAMTPIGTPSKDKQHPDYTPPLFSYGRHNAKKTARKSMKSRMAPYSLKLEPDTYSTGSSTEEAYEDREFQDYVSAAFSNEYDSDKRTARKSMKSGIKPNSLNLKPVQMCSRSTGNSTEEAYEDGKHQDYVPAAFSNEYATGNGTARKSMKSGIKPNSLNLKPVQMCSRSSGTPPVIKQDATTMTQLTGSEIDRLRKTIEDQAKMLSGRRNMQLANKATPGKLLYVVSMQSR